MAPYKYPSAYKPKEAELTKEEKEQIQKEFEEEERKEKEKNDASNYYPGEEKKDDLPSYQDVVYIPPTVEIVKSSSTASIHSNDGQVVGVDQSQQSQKLQKSQQQPHVVINGEIYVKKQIQEECPSEQKQTILIKRLDNTTTVPRCNMNMVCPYCKKQIYTKIIYENNSIIYLLFLVLCCFTGICGFLVCFFNGLKDCVHYCPECGREISRNTREM